MNNVIAALGISESEIANSNESANKFGLVVVLANNLLEVLLIPNLLGVIFKYEYINIEPLIVQKLDVLYIPNVTVITSETPPALISLMDARDNRQRNRNIHCITNQGIVMNQVFWLSVLNFLYNLVEES